MTIQERLIGNVTLIHLGGRVARPDDANLLRDTLQRLIGQGRINLVLDFQEVPYIDSEALAVRPAGVAGVPGMNTRAAPEHGAVTCCLSYVNSRRAATESHPSVVQTNTLAVWAIADA